jgi:hypothetical protein
MPNTRARTSRMRTRIDEYEQEKNYPAAKRLYLRVLDPNPMTCGAGTV